MATTPSISETAVPAGEAQRSGARLLVSLSPQGPDALVAILARLSEAFPDGDIVVATPDVVPGEAAGPHGVTYTPAMGAVPTSWLLSAADYLNTYKLAEEYKAETCLLLGPEAQSLGAAAVRALAEPVMTGKADLALPHYELGPHDGLVNSAILYPVSRALFSARVRYPLAVDLAFSVRMAERLATTAQRHTATGQTTALIWPVAEAATAAMTIVEARAGARTLPPPGTLDLNTVLAQVAGSLFADVDAKAGFWQRARLAAARNGVVAGAGSIEGETLPPDVTPMLESFRLAYANLHEIWSLVLPPNSLLGLKKLSLLPDASFRMPDALWARIVYDFILAWRLRTLNRGHLMGALTPLYLAWVASHLLQTAEGNIDPHAPERHIEAVAAAFEADKPYLVSRWRWPDRFNP